MQEHEWACPPDSPGTSGSFLRGFRDRLRLTQQEMALKAGVDRSLIARIEADQDVRVGTLTKIVEALGCRLILAARSPRPLQDMAEDHVPARQIAWEASQKRRNGGSTSPSSTGSPF
jgi:transcriptional regulator with XRE-family HTH domain